MAKYSRTNLIINYLPQAFSDEEFRALFSSVAPVKRAKVCRDKRSGYSFGFGFCEFYTAEDASRAIRALNGLRLHRKTIKVAHARLQSAESKNCNLHITNLPTGVTIDEIRAVLEPHGGIINCKILPCGSRPSGGGSGGGGATSHSVGFCLFETRSAAASALAALNGKPWPGTTEAADASVQHVVQVRFADENEKKVRPPVNHASPALNSSLAPPMHPPLPLQHLSLPLSMPPQPPPPLQPPLLSHSYDFGNGASSCFYAMQQQHNLPPPPPPLPPPYGYPAFASLATFPQPPQFYSTEPPQLPQPQPVFTVSVCNLPPGLDEPQLWSMFSQFGAMFEARLEPGSGRQPAPAEGDLQPPGASAAVSFVAYQSAAAAATYWNGQSVGGRQLQAWLRLP